MFGLEANSRIKIGVLLTLLVLLLPLSDYVVPQGFQFAELMRPIFTPC